MTTLVVILIGLTLFCLVSIFGALKAINEQSDLIQDIIDLIKHEQEGMANEIKCMRVENTRLRRLLGEYNDEEDIFPAKQHKIVSFKRGDDNGSGAG